MFSKFSSYKPFSKRGQPVTNIVKQVGKYFPFVNRDRSLLNLWERLVLNIEWAETQRGKIDSYKNEGAQYIVCCGASGIGKTTFATDGLVKLSECINKLDPHADPKHV